MKIVENLRLKTAKIQDTWQDGGQLIAENMRSLAILAMEEGLKPPVDGQPSAWVTYINEITTDPDEIKRLTGQDAVYNSRDNAKGVQMYIVGNGLCTEHSFADTTRYLKAKELRELDA